MLGEAGAEIALHDVGNDLAGGGALEAGGGAEVSDEFAVVGVDGAKQDFASETFWIGTGHGVRFLGRRSIIGVTHDGVKMNLR